MTDSPFGSQKVDSVTRPATAHGWMRRLDLEEMNPGHSVWIWERPNGELLAVNQGLTPMITTYTAAQP